MIMRRTKNKSIAKTQKDTVVKDWALLGSVITNIVQAINQAVTTRDLAAARTLLQRIKVDRDTLVRELRQWQNAYLSLKGKADRLEHGFIDLKKAISRQNDDLYKLQQELLNKDEQIKNLEKENAELKIKMKKL